MTEKAFHVSWDQFHRDARALAWRLSASARFSGMVAITRGGLVPAAIVARELDMRIIDTFCVASYAREKIQGEAKVLKSVLPRPWGWRRGPSRVDDLADTGATVKLVRAVLAEGACRDGLCETARASPRGYFYHRGIAGHLDLFSLGPWPQFSGADRRAGAGVRGGSAVSIARASPLAPIAWRTHNEMLLSPFAVDAPAVA